MDPQSRKSRSCPECGSGEYAFRSRKRIVGERDQPAMVETKYRCKACNHEWRVKVIESKKH